MNKDKVKLIDVVDSWISGDWGEDQPSNECNKKVFCIRSADIVPIYNNSFDIATTRYISDRSFNNNQLSIGDIIVEKSGGTATCSTGRVIYVNEDILRNNSPLVCSNFCTAFRVKKEWDAQYIYYLLRFIHSKGIFMNFEGKTSGIHNLDINAAYGAIEVPDIDLKTQKQISSFLSKIDNKIALNCAINQNLEALAKQLYDYWFVQFDFPNEEGKPYKSSGGAMVWNEKLKREIPEGWSNGIIGDLFSSQPGFAFKSSEWKENGHPVLTIKNIQEDGSVTFSDASFIDKYDKKFDKYSANNGNMIFAMSGNTIGKIGIISSKIHNVLINQRVLIIKTNLNTIAFPYFVLTDKKIQKLVFQLGANSAQPNISEEEFRNIKICIPQQSVLNNFNQLFKHSFELIINDRIECDNLRNMRDELLPLLMNGQVSLNAL